MSSIDELTINDAEIVPEIGRDKNGGRQGLRRSKRPVNSHRNMYEREFSHANIKSGSERKPAWYNKKKRKLVKIRSDRWTQNRFTKIVGTVFAQITRKDKHAHTSVPKDIERHGEKALNALLDEFGQIHKHDTFTPQFANELMAEQINQALQIITMIKEKRCGKVKARTCVDGRKQRKYIKKDDVSSPTVQQESLITSMMIDATEGRDVATADIVGAYLLAQMNDYVLVKLTGKVVETMCIINDTCKQYVTLENGKKVLYLRLKKNYMDACSLPYYGTTRLKDI